MSHHEIIMPSLSAGMEEGTVARWLKRAGDAVSVGEIIAEIETDKATFELLAESAGVIESASQDGDTVAVGAALGRIATAGGTAAPTGDGHESLPDRPPRHTRSSPLARRLARDRNIDLAAVQGSGPAGRIVRLDIERIVPSKTGSSAEPRAAPGPVAVAPRNVGGALHLATECDAAPLLALRVRLAAAGRPDVATTDFLVKAAGLAVAFTLGKQEASVGIASFEGEIMLGQVPGTSLGKLAASRRNAPTLPTQGRADAASITLVNLGRSGVQRFHVSDLPTSGNLLIVGSMERGVDGGSGPVRLPLTLSVSSEVVEPRDALRLLASIRSLIEAPLQLLA